MKVTYHWLKNFVEIKIAPRVLAEKLTMVGLEVTALEEKEGDFIFEIEVTANRPDCLSVLGIAREVAAITKSKIKNQKSKPQFKTQKFKNAKDSLKIEIQNRKDCPLYTAKIIKEVKVGPSPDWLKKRLELVGCRSVNNIVDITNYVLFEYGEPLHAFDWDRLNNDAIIVRRAKKDEKITTIDGEQRMLDTDILVIADKEKPVAVAGVIGGKDTEVSQSTKNILLEAAIFNRIIVRRGRQKLGIQSESSYRFERGVDLEIVEKASWRAVELIQELADGRYVLVRSAGKPLTKSKEINLGLATVNKILGVNIASAQIKRILKELGFQVETKPGNNFAIRVPGYRQDVNLEIDLIEEIARISGYENIPVSLPKIRPYITGIQIRNLVSTTKNILVGLGLNEVITYSLLNKELLRCLGRDEEGIEILNPLSKEQETLRPTLAPGLLECINLNLNQRQSHVNIFEIAKVFLKNEGSSCEEFVLGIALCGTKSWLLTQGLIKEEASLLHLKGILETLFERLGIKDYGFKQEASFYQVNVYMNKEKIGVINALSKGILEKFGIKNQDVFVAEIFLEKIFSTIAPRKRIVSLPKYPGILRDISFILKEDTPADDILQAIREKGKPLLQEVKIVDYYKGKQIPERCKGLTLSCFYRLDERTLTEAEVNTLHSLICVLLADRFGAKIRA